MQQLGNSKMLVLFSVIIIPSIQKFSVGEGLRFDVMTDYLLVYEFRLMN